MWEFGTVGTREEAAKMQAQAGPVSSPAAGEFELAQFAVKLREVFGPLA